MKTLIYAIRFLTRSKSYTLINLLGLAFSLACCIILMRYLHREWTVDSHCIRPNEVVTVINKNGDYQYPVSQQNLIRFHPELKEILIPDDQIIESCEFVTLPNIDFQDQETPYYLDLLAVDSTFFHFFDYPLVEGELRINTPQDAILTKACAQRLFGKKSAVGKTLRSFGKDITIRGVIDQPSCKTILNFEILTSYQLTEWSRIGGGWLRISPKQTNLDAFNAKTNVFGSVKPDQIHGNANVRNEYIHWQDIYYDHWTEDTETVKLGNRTYERMLIGVIIVLLLVGMVNFINLYMVYITQLHSRKASISPEAMGELRELAELCMRSVTESLSIFECEDYSRLPLAEELESAVDKSQEQCIENHIRRLMCATCDPNGGVVFSDMVIDLERCSDHAINIAAALSEC